MMCRRIVLLASIAAAALLLLPASGARAEFPDVVLRDDFSDATTGIFPRQSPSPSDYWLGYVSGQYRIWKFNPAYEGAPAVFFNLPVTDSSIAVDAWTAGDTPGDYLDLWCRRNTDQGVSGYRLTIFTKVGSYLLTRWDSTVPATLSSGALPAPVAGQWFRAELQCTGPWLTGLVNGVPIVVAEDGTYQQGQPVVGAGVSTDHGPGYVDAWIDNFVLSRPTGPVGPPPRP